MKNLFKSLIQTSKKLHVHHTLKLKKDRIFLNKKISLNRKKCHLTRSLIVKMVLTKKIMEILIVYHGNKIKRSITNFNSEITQNNTKTKITF